MAAELLGGSQAHHFFSTNTTTTTTFNSNSNSNSKSKHWSNFSSELNTLQQPWLGGAGIIRNRNRNRNRGNRVVVGVSSSSSSFIDLITSSSSIHHQIPPLSSSSHLFLLADTSAGGYSLASYYTSLGLFVISVPGLWSLIKRSVKSKIVKKTFIGPEEEKKEPNQVAGEILSFFTRNNFAVTDRGETITFEGAMVPSRGQAALLTFCTCISLASVALVLTITAPDAGNNWFYLTLLSPLAGIYYWKKASRKEQIKVKMVVAENGTLSEIIVQGDDQQVDQLRRELLLTEKGMVYVKGLFER